MKLTHIDPNIKTEVAPDTDVVTALFTAQKAAFQADNPGYSYSGNLVYVDGRALNTARPQDLDALLQAVIDGREVLYADNSKTCKMVATPDMTERLRGLIGKGMGSWKLWACYGGFVRFTDNRAPGAWLGALMLEAV